MAGFAGYVAHLRAGLVPIDLVLVRFDFADGEVRIANTDIPVTIGSEVWGPGGGVIDFQGVGQTFGNAVAGTMVMTVNGVDREWNRRAHQDSTLFKGRDIDVYCVSFSQDGRQLDPLATVFSGWMHRLTGTHKAGDDGVERRLMLHCESFLSARFGAPNSTYSDFEQNERQPGDRGCRFVGTLEFNTVTWPPAG